MPEALHDDDTSRPCSHERSHVVDSAFHRGGYSTAESRRIFCDVCRLQRWLEVPDVGWHVARDRVAEFIYLLALIAASLARAADEIRTLCRPEFAELEERWDAGRLGSSTMPHKRNPENAEQVVVLAPLARAQVALGLECMIVEHERDYRGTRLEWPAVTSVSHYTLTALALTRVVVNSITVRCADMEDTARELADLACTEALTFLLGQRVGQAKAFSIVHRLAQDALDRRKTVLECALASHELGLVLDRSMIEQTFDPAAYLGSAGELVDRVLATRRRACAIRATRASKQS